MQKTNYNFWKSFRESCKRVWKAMKEELQMILNDWGFIIVFFGATLFYPLLYPMIYRNEKFVICRSLLWTNRKLFFLVI
jgi:hypothetical protein